MTDQDIEKLIDNEPSQDRPDYDENGEPNE